jgi:cobalt-precorrin 5A hydrolase
MTALQTDQTAAKPAARPAIYAFTSQGAALARRVGLLQQADVYLHTRCARPGEAHFDSIRDLVARTFSSHTAHIFVGAAGIAVRAIAPHLHSKAEDPCVLALDQNGAFCVSLVSGHLGGGNALARDIADITGGQAVITTATDSQSVPAIDLLAQQAGLVIGNLETIKNVSGHLLDGGKAALHDPDDHLHFSQHPELAPFFEPADADSAAAAPCAVWIDHRVCPAAPGHLMLHPKNLCVGVGCRRGVASQDILTHLRMVFAEHNLHMESIALLASINAKHDEAGLLEAARLLGVPVQFHSAEVLRRQPVVTRSERVREHMGVDSVCEAAALARTEGSRLLVSKTKNDRITVAVAC